MYPYEAVLLISLLVAPKLRSMIMNHAGPSASVSHSGLVIVIVSYSQFSNWVSQSDIRAIVDSESAKLSHKVVTPIQASSSHSETLTVEFMAFHSCVSSCHSTFSGHSQLSCHSERSEESIGVLLLSLDPSPSSSFHSESALDGTSSSFCPLSQSWSAFDAESRLSFVLFSSFCSFPSFWGASATWESIGVSLSLLDPSLPFHSVHDDDVSEVSTWLHISKSSTA